MPLFTPEVRQSLLAQLEYYRDLGLYDFYQRSVTSTASPPMQPATEETSDLPLILVPEEPPIAARKSANAPPLIHPTQNYSRIAGKGASALVQIREEIGDCTRCKLSVGRNKIVFGDGDPDARLMFVGEGPGADEDAQGLPFVGRAGQLLNNMINAMGLKREQVYIANIVKCRPPQNRVPEPDEAGTCMPFLEQQIAAVQPEVIVALGSTAATYLLGAKTSLGSLRGKIHASRNAKVIVTYHPAFLLRDPRQKKEAWADLKIAMKELGLRPPSAPPPA
jgi:DNA polymerase